MSDNKNKRGRLLVISGFSGVGKGTVIRRLMEVYPDYAFSVSATTREKRPGEEHGKDYFFIDQDTFEQWVQENRFLEYARFFNRAYGTLREHVDKLRDAGKTVILDIEVEGAMNVLKTCPEAVLIYLIPPDGKELVRRITGRGTESREQILGRLRKAVGEADIVPRYRHVVVNDDVDEAVHEIHSLTHRRRGLRVNRREALAQTKRVKAELAEILKEMESCDNINN